MFYCACVIDQSIRHQRILFISPSRCRLFGRHGVSMFGPTCSSVFFYLWISMGIVPLSFFFSERKGESLSLTLSLSLEINRIVGIYKVDVSFITPQCTHVHTNTYVHAHGHTHTHGHTDTYTRTHRSTHVHTHRHAHQSETRIPARILVYEASNWLRRCLSLY